MIRSINHDALNLLPSCMYINSEYVHANVTEKELEAKVFCTHFSALNVLSFSRGLLIVELLCSSAITYVVLCRGLLIVELLCSSAITYVMLCCVVFVSVRRMCLGTWLVLQFHPSSVCLSVCLSVCDVGASYTEKYLQLVMIVMQAEINEGCLL